MITIDGLSIEGVSVGQASNEEAATGCTVILADEGAVAGVDVRGGGPATRETDLLRPENSIEKINAVILSGGSAYGLDAAGGVMKWCEEHGRGFDSGVGLVPIVSGACLFDLQVGENTVRPDAAMGYAACEQTRETVESGNVGAGCGATVGKLCGPARSMKSGLGTAAVETSGIKVACISAVNALGTVVDAQGAPLAGVVADDGTRVLSPEEALAQSATDPWSGNTTISCIITDAALTKAQVTKVAQITHDAYARAIRPVHTTNDGDTIFVLSVGDEQTTVDTVGYAAAKACEDALRNAVLHATPAHGLKAASDFL